MNARHPLTIICLATVLLLTVWGCSDQQSLVEPLNEIALVDGAVLHGTVLDTGGRPAVAAILALEAVDLGLSASVRGALDGHPDLAAKAGGLLTAVSDQSGRYTFSGLEAGDYLLTSSLRDHAGDSRSLKILPLAATNAETTFVDIQLTPTGTFLGNAVLENATDHTGTIVFLEGTSYVAVTDAAGDYSLTGVPIGTWPARAMHSGYLDDTAGGTLINAGDMVTLSAMTLRLSANIPPAIGSFTATFANEGNATGFNWTASDPDGVVVLFEIDFENDGVFEFSSLSEISTLHTYPAEGQYLAKLRVTDDEGASDLAVVQVVVSPAQATEIYVSPFGDDDAPGTTAQPVQTIGQGLTLAQQPLVTAVFVAEGTYSEVVNLADGISMYGGRDPMTWAPQPGVHSVITGDTRPLRAQGIVAPTVVESFEFLALNASGIGESSVAATLTGCSSDLAFQNCRFISGNGGQGQDGFPGPAGGQGTAGQNGSFGDCDDTYNNPGGTGGFGAFSGGDGGAGGNQFGNGAHGGSGSTGGGSGGGSGGSGGTTNSNQGNPGQDGFSGSPGLLGTGGIAGAFGGSIIGNLWTPEFAGSGTDGGSGNGGGGGGGGGGQEGTFVIDGVGNSGGGGGGGGFGGGGGGGGQAGGGSFGLLMVTSSPSVIDCTFIGANGGDGGSGGSGGGGGNGGNGGAGAVTCISDIGRGGDGGNGGAGGLGGGGGGGYGGPSYGVYNQGGMPTLVGNTFVAGSGGTGGLGGSPGGQDGPSGDSASIN